MFHCWRPNWDLSNWRPNVVHPESLSWSSVTFKVSVCVCFPLQVFRLVGTAPQPWTDTHSPMWFNLSAEMKSLVVVYSLWAQITSINLFWFEHRIATDPLTQSKLVKLSDQQFSFCTRLNKWQHMLLCKSVNRWPLCMCADYGPKWQGSISWKCHFRIDLYQASSCVTISTAWLTDVRRRKCVAISSLVPHEVGDSGGCFCCC